jgi:hypothetical protein
MAATMIQVCMPLAKFGKHWKHFILYEPDFPEVDFLLIVSSFADIYARNRENDRQCSDFEVQAA